jgi:hypothetical protein
MSSVEGVSDFEGQIEERFERKGLAFDAVLESLAVEEFHGDKLLAVLFADFVNGTNVGMIEGGSGLGFAFEAREGLRVAGDFGREKFESYEAVEICVFGFVDDAHPAAAQFFEDAIVRDVVDGGTSPWWDYSCGVGGWSTWAGTMRTCLITGDEGSNQPDLDQT